MNYSTLFCIETEIIYHAYKYHRSEKGLKWVEVNGGLHPQLIRKNVGICGLAQEWQEDYWKNDFILALVR